jgi:hypothetical protein
MKTLKDLIGNLPLPDFLTDRLDEIQVSNYQVVTDAGGVTASLELALTNGLLSFEFSVFTVRILGIEAVSLSIREEPSASMTFPDIEVALSGFFRPAERVDGAWIVRENDIQQLVIDSENIALQISFYSGISVADRRTDGGFGLPALSLPPTALGKTGIILQIEQLTPVLNARQVTPNILALGFNSGFKGIYAESARISWLSQIQLHQNELPGLEVELQQLALGNEGISFDAGVTWPVVYDDAGRFVAEETDMLGYLFETSWALAVESVAGTVRRNIPESFAVAAFLHVPFFRAIFSASFSLSTRLNTDHTAYKIALALAKVTSDPIEVSYLNDRFSFSLLAFSAEGFLSDDGFGISGQAGFTAVVYDFAISVGGGAFSYTHQQGRDTFDFQLSEVVLGELGQVDQARLIIEADRDANDDFRFRQLQITAEYAWEDIKGLVPADLQEQVNLPDDGRIEALISWADTGAGANVVVDLKTEVSHLDNLWQFIPAAYRPSVRSVRSMFRITYASAEAFSAGASAGENRTVELTAAMELGLPGIDHLALPGFDLIDLQAGNEEGFMNAIFSAQYRSQQSQEAFTAGLALENPIAVDIRLPGVDSQQPFIQSALEQIGLEFAAQDDTDNTQVGGTLLFEGDFIFRPLAPGNFPFASHLNALLRQVGLEEVSGRTGARLDFTAEDFNLAFQGKFEGLGITLDVFDLLGSLAPSAGSVANSEMDIDFDIGFQLMGFTFRVGTEEGPDTGGDFYFSFQLDVECYMTGLPPVRAAITLSDDEFSFGLEDFSIPITIPRYPIDVEDLDRLLDQNGVWSVVDSTPGHAYLAELEDQEAALVAQLEEEASTSAETFRLTQDLASLEIKRLLVQLVMAVHQRVQTGGEEAVQTYQNLVWADTWLHSTVLNFLHLDTNLKLHFPEIKFKIPFDNPKGIALSGTGRLTGFADDDPLKGLEEYTFTLGLSTQYIFAQIESTADPIPIPGFGTRYDDGAVSISKFMIGYGYSKNSFAFDFAGELMLPTQLIQDANTSALLGFGVQLPRYTKLAFKLDVMVLTIGKVTVTIPLPQFDLDLRTPNAPALVNTRRCEPYWDGLELIIRDVLHYDLKRLAFSPFFAMNIIPNLRYDGDVKLGDEENGLTLIVNDLLLLLGQATSSGIIPIPFFADPYQPYFSNICVNLRLSGFELNFNLERPFPSLSPLSLLEVFGLISNPMMEIDPQGSLANTIRFTLSDGYVKAPDYVLRAFPQAAGLPDKRYAFTFNLGVLITMAQTVAGCIQPAIDQTRSYLENSAQNLQNWQQNIPKDFDPWALASLLPVELRVFRLKGGLLGGFQAGVCIVLTTEAEAREALKNKDADPNEASGAIALKTGKSFYAYEKFSTPKYKPTSGYDFLDSWLQEGSATSWTYADKTITHIGELAGASYFIFQKDIPEKMHVSGRFSAPYPDQNLSFGWVFAYQNTNSYYILRTAQVESGLQKVVLHKKENGVYLPAPLLEKTLYVPDNGELELELITYLEESEKVLVVRSAREEVGRTRDPHPLANGRIGLYVENGGEVRFSETVVYELQVVARQYGELDGTDFQPNLPVSLLGNRPLRGSKSSRALFRSEEFTAFNEQHVDLIPVDRLRAEDAGSGSVFMGARLTVLDGFVLQFFGRLYQTGAFALVSEAGSQPLELPVFGMATKIPFGGYGQLKAVGRPDENGFEGYVEANGHFRWAAVPNVLEIAAGNPHDPVSVQIRTNGRFNLSAAAAIDLFGGAAAIKGRVDISHEQCVFSGQLDYQVGDLIGLHIKGRGGLSHRPLYWFEGVGDVMLFGKEIAKTAVSLENGRARLALLLSTRNLPHFDFLDASFDVGLQLSGEVDIERKGRPVFDLSGNGYLAAAGARLEGMGGVRRVLGKRAQDDRSELYIGGKMSWQGQDWWQAQMSIDTHGGVQLSGYTQFGLMLSPGNFGGVEVANLYLNLSLGGAVGISTRGRFQFEMDLVWTLGVSLPGREKQLLPLASDEVRIEGDMSSPLELIDLSGFRLFPVEGFNISLPVPEIVGKGDPVFRIGVKNDKIALNVPEWGTLYIDEREFVSGLTGGSLPSLSPGSLPSLSPGSLPNLNAGSLPSLSKGSLPSLSINFLAGTFNFSRGTLPSLDKGSLPSLDKGSLPSLNAGSLPSLNKGSFPELKKGKIPFPVYEAGRHFDPGHKPQDLHAQYEVQWKQQVIPIEFAAFKSSPVRLGFDQQRQVLFIQLGGKKYQLDGRLLGR